VQEPEGDERPWEQAGAIRPDCIPHRGPQLLRLGFASVLLAPAGVGLALGAIVWCLANWDLQQMRSGLMHAAGRTDTEDARQYAITGALTATYSLACVGALALLHIVEAL
jgi:hypothetical protein